MAEEPLPLTFLAKRGTVARSIAPPQSDDLPKPHDFLGQAGLYSSTHQRLPSREVEEDRFETGERIKLHKASSFEFPPPLTSLPSLSKIVINRKPRRKTKNLTPTPFWLHPPHEQEQSNSTAVPPATKSVPLPPRKVSIGTGHAVAPSMLVGDPEDPTHPNLVPKAALPTTEPSSKSSDEESLLQYRSRMLERATVRRNRVESATRRQTPLTDAELDAWLRGDERHPHLRNSISKEIALKPRNSRGDSLQPSETDTSSAILDAGASPVGEQGMKPRDTQFPPPQQLNRFELALHNSFGAIEALFRMYPRDGNILMEALSTLKDFYARDIATTKEVRLSVFSAKAVQKRKEMLQPARKEVSTLQQRIEASLNELKGYTNWEEGVLKGESTRLAEVKAAAEKAKEHLGLSKTDVANNLIVISSLFEQQAQQSLEIDEIEELEQEVAEAEARKTEMSIKESALVKQLSRERQALAQWGIASEYEELSHRVSEKGAVLPGKKVALLRQVKYLDGRKAGLENQLKGIEAENAALDYRLSALKEQYRSREAVELRAWTPRPNIDRECPVLEKELRVKGSAAVQQGSGRSTASFLETSIKKLLQQQSNLKRLQEEQVRFYHILAPVARPFDVGRGAQLPFLPGSQLSVYFPAPPAEEGLAPSWEQSPSPGKQGSSSPPSAAVGGVDGVALADPPSTTKGNTAAAVGGGGGGGVGGRRVPPPLDSLGRQTSSNAAAQGGLAQLQFTALSPALSQGQGQSPSYGVAPSGPFASTTRWWPTYGNEDGIHAFLISDEERVPNENWGLAFTDRVAFVVLKTVASSKGAAALKASGSGSMPVSPAVSSSNLNTSGSAFLIEVFSPAIVAIWGPNVDIRVKLVNLVMHCKRYVSQCPLLACLLHIIGGRLPLNFAEGPLGFLQRLLSPCSSSGSETQLKNLFILMVKEMEGVPFSSIELMQLRYALLNDASCNAATRTVRWRDLLDCYDGKAALATLQTMWMQQFSGDGDASPMESTVTKLGGTTTLSLTKSALSGSLTTSSTEKGKATNSSPTGNPASPTQQLSASSPRGPTAGDMFPLSPVVKGRTGENPSGTTGKSMEAAPNAPMTPGQSPMNKTGLFLRTVFFHYFVHMSFAYSKIEVLMKNSSLTSELHPFVALVDAQVFKVKLEALRWESHEVQGFKAVKYHEHKLCAVQVKHLLDQLKVRCGLFAGSLHFTQEPVPSGQSAVAKPLSESSDLLDGADLGQEIVGSKTKPYFELTGLLTHLREIPLKITFK